MIEAGEYKGDSKKLANELITLKRNGEITEEEHKELLMIAVSLSVKKSTEL
jgi:hypothetical protein